MQYNYNPQGYSFTSSIPDIFKVSDFQGSSVYLAIYINRSEEPIFSTTLYAYGGQASIYDLRSIIESYMEEKSLVHAACSFRMQVDRNDFTLGEFTLIYCKPQIQNADCKQFLQSHFLTPHAVRLVPHDFQIDLQYFVFPDETGQCSTLFVIQPEGECQPISLSVSALPIASKQFDLCFEDLNEDDLLAQLPQGTKGKLLSVTLYRGARTFTLFFTDEPPTLTLYYYNAFNVYDTLYLTAQTKRKLSFDRSTAICCGQSSSYDDNTEVEYESETSALSYLQAKHVTYALQSHTLFLISPDYPSGTSILITDIESELSDATTANCSVKLKWKPVRQQPVLTFTRKRNIFNSIYNNSFD